MKSANLRSRMAALAILYLCLFTTVSSTPAQGPTAAPAVNTIQVTDFLPNGFVKDGSISYQTQLQKAIDSVGTEGGEIIFAPMAYRITDPSGLRLHSNLTLRLQGASFLVDDKCDEDGQVFSGTNVSDLSIEGGTISGHDVVWQEGINIRGVYLTGRCSRIRIRNMHIRDLSSNGIGVFASDEEHPATDIWILDTIIENCCNHYGDYQAPPPEKRGPEKGSTREDQGLVAFYHVHGFTVRGCRLDDSRSDGTHFYFCRHGQFIDNRVARAKMGGYFLESCQHVLAANNVVRDNGSRGVTIERGSQFCTLTGNTITGSGREGLWIPDSLHCVVTGNVFSLNGRKSNGDQLHTIWNANITINEAKGDTLQTPTAHYLISDNIIETDQHQIAAIRVDTRAETQDILIEGNLLAGSNRRILVEGSDQQAVNIGANHGGEIERRIGDDENGTDSR